MQCRLPGAQTEMCFNHWQCPRAGGGGSFFALLPFWMEVGQHVAADRGLRAGADTARASGRALLRAHKAELRQREGQPDWAGGWQVASLAWEFGWLVRGVGEAADGVE